MTIGIYNSSDVVRFNVDHGNTINWAKMKKVSVFPVRGLKILGRVGTHFFHYYFLNRNAFQNAKIIFFVKKPP